jgi:hypothetical protein
LTVGSWDGINPAVKECKKLYVQGGKNETGHAGSEGFIAAKVFVEEPMR